MIDAPNETTCLACGQPLNQIAGRGHRKKLYCDDRCRQKGHRSKGQDNATNDTMLQARIVELERELEQTHHLIDTYINRRRTPTEWKRQLQERWLRLGKVADWPALTIPIRVQSGERAYRLFALSASNELLEEGNVTLRRHLEET